MKWLLEERVGLKDQTRMVRHPEAGNSEKPPVPLSWTMRGIRVTGASEQWGAGRWAAQGDCGHSGGTQSQGETPHWGREGMGNKSLTPPAYPSLAWCLPRAGFSRPGSQETPPSEVSILGHRSQWKGPEVGLRRQWRKSQHTGFYLIWCPVRNKTPVLDEASSAVVSSSPPATREVSSS